MPQLATIASRFAYKMVAYYANCEKSSVRAQKHSNGGQKYKYNQNISRNLQLKLKDFCLKINKE